MHDMRLIFNLFIKETNNVIVLVKIRKQKL